MPKVQFDKKTREAFRVVGHLLETNGTTKAYARTASGKETYTYNPNACRFCLQGAVDVVSKLVFHISDIILSQGAECFIGGRAETDGLIDAWDRTNKAGRRAIVEKLKSA